jgi:hypothetical protein
MDDVEKSRSNPIYDNVEEGMLEKWKSIGGRKVVHMGWLTY